MRLITGHTGERNVYAIDDANIYKLLIGNGNYVLPYGNTLSLREDDVHVYTVLDGYLIAQGRQAVVRIGEEETFNLDGGINGYYTRYIIAAEYSMDENNIESMKLVAVKGDAAAQAAVKDPELYTGDIDSGETVQIPLWRITLNGRIAVSQERMTNVLTRTPIDDLYNQLNTMKTAIDTKLAGIDGTVNSKCNSKFSELSGKVDEKLNGILTYYHAKGTTWSGNLDRVCAGHITNGGTQIYFNIPSNPMFGTVKCNYLDIVVRYADGGYIDIKSGTKHTIMGSKPVRIVSNGKANVKGISSVTATQNDGNIKIIVNTSEKMLKEDKSNKAINNSPVSVLVTDSSFTLS